MATGGGFPRLKQSKSETKQRSSNWPRSVSSDKDDSLSLTSFPSDIRINNWDLSDLRPTASVDSRRRKKSKGNPEREREQSLSMDSPPHGEPKQRTPTSLSRTRNTPTAQRDALEKLKQKLTYDEEQYSTDGERNNERSVARSRRRNANNREVEGASGGGSGSRRPRSNRNNNTEHGPDRNQIVGRLVQIQDYIKQATSMMETLQKSGDSGSAEDLAKVGRLISNLQEQEQGYFSLLQTNAALRMEAAEAGNDGLPVEGATKRESDSDESVDLEVESNASETTERTSSSSRPRIEDKLGLGSEEERGSDDSKDEDTTMDNTVVSQATATAQAMAVRNVAETLNSLTQEREDSAGATGGDLTAQQRQQLMRVMMEKQEQLRQLQSRQDQLLSMKKEAELRLQQAQARDNQARAALAAVEAGQVALEEEGAFLDQAEGQLKSNIVGYPESDDDETSNARETDPLTELHRQLSFLRNEFSAETERRPRNNTDSSGGGVPGGGAGAGLALGMQQQQLQDKLKDLQQKKRSMDHLLAQLETLRSHRLQVMNNEASTGRPPLSLPPSQQPLPPPPPPPPTASSAPQPPAQPSLTPDRDMAAMLAGMGDLSSLSELMSSMGAGEGGGLMGWPLAMQQGDSAPSAEALQETREKMEKLQEVRQRLNQLKELVQYYQKIRTQPAPEETQGDDGQSDANDQDPLGLHRAGEALRSGFPPETCSTSLPSLNAGGTQSEGTFLQIQEALASAVSEEQSDEDNASASEDWEAGLGPWDRDPEVQEKVRKLMKAKDKLRDLQGLIAAIECMPEGEKFPDVSQNSSVGQHPPRGAQARVTDGAAAEEGAPEGGNASVSEGEVPPGLSPADSQRVAREEGRLQQQMDELSRLRDERERLLALQQQLHTLQDRFVEAERDSETEGRPEGSLRKGDGSQPPSTSVVTFASNDELYSKMRDQRIEREELRSKKKELEAIMKKDQNRRQYIRNQDNQSDNVSYTTGTDAFGASASADATMATWGGSTVDNLENITEDEDGQDGGNRPEDDDDGYPSDGIVQVEEEEEENETDNGTYTINSNTRCHDVTQQARGQSQGQGARPKTSRGRRGFPQPIRTAGSSKKSSKRLQSQPWGRVSREERLAHRQGQLGSGDGVAEDPTLRQFRQQLEKMTSLCQNLMATPASSSSGQPQGMMQAQLATLQSSDVSTPTQLDMQSQLMREMQQQQLMLAVSQCNQQLMMQQFDMAALQRQLQQLTGQMSSLQQASPAAILPGTGGAPSAQPGQPGVLMPQPYLSPLSSTLAAHVPNNIATSVNVQSSRQTTFTVNPNFTSNPFTSDPQRFPLSQAVQTTSVDGLSEDAERGQVRQSEGGAGSSFPRPMRLWEEAESRGHHSRPSDTVPKVNLQTFLKARRKKNSRRRSSDKCPQKPAESERGTNYRPGLSAGISGTAFDDAASVSSLASSQPEGAVGGQRTQTESRELGELNLFEELRETIYTEVATLISQNESRPQYLLQLFSELQGMTSDLMRQRAIFALQEIAQSTLVAADAGGGREAALMKQLWPPSRTDQDNIAAELTPSEGMLTSDDEDIKARVRQHASALERKKQRNWSAAQGNSLKNDKFDYAEMAVTTSSMSTPTNDNGESPFSRDSLGDTVIHLDKALAKMRREMQQAEQERAERARCAVVMETQQDMSGDVGLGDQGSESSISDMPYPRIDAQELDEQIKGVMGQVIPVIKEHINDVFSPQLLSYIQRLVLSLVRQPGHTHEFARFFYGQLASILHDSLTKFEGRRVREVGEDVLLDMSEVLFNELAFLRIMRDLDNPVAMEKIRKQSWFNSQPLSSQRASAAQVGEDYDAASNESDNEASDDKDDDDLTPKNVKVNGMDEEEEELGKERDDELARKLVTQVGDEKDEDTEEQHSSSAVHIQLAMSETKPFTRIGSDEDTEGSDESLSLEDPSDTAVSRSTMMEHRQDTTLHTPAATTATPATPPSNSGSAAQKASPPSPSPPQQKEATTEREEEKEADTSEADGTLDSRGPADGSRGSSSAAAAVECSGAGGGDAAGAGGEEKGEVQVNGIATSPEEEEEELAVGLEDLPPVLNVADPESVEQKRQEEDMATTGVSGILNSLDTREELAGDGSALKEPDSTGK